MQNILPCYHEMLHALYQDQIGTSHIMYKTVDPPEVKKSGQKGPAATVIVHDNWYGFKTKITTWYWILFWLPIKMPYIPIKKAKILYNLENN